MTLFQLWTKKMYGPEVSLGRYLAMSDEEATEFFDKLVQHLEHEDDLTPG